METLATIGDAIAAGRLGYEDLTALGEEIEDEWSYVTDLTSSWLERFAEVDLARGGQALPDVVAAAVLALVAESAAIDDPHRAIDWLSTFPQVLLVALGEPT